MATYLRPTGMDEALQALDSAPRVIVAGGTDYYPARVGQPLDDDVLDLTALPGLRGVDDRGDHYRIGALTTWTDVIRADLPSWLDGLKRAAREVGGVQIQNAGTVAGNICNASPAADGVPALLALDATVELASAAGGRTVPRAAFKTRNRATVRAQNEMVVGLSVTKPAGPAAAVFLKLGARRYLVISIVMVAGVIEAAPDGTVASARLAVGSCAAVARRLGGLEAALAGRTLSPALADVVTPAHLSVLAPIDDIRGSAAYRSDAALTLVRRAVAELGGAL